MSEWVDGKSVWCSQKTQRKDRKLSEITANKTVGKTLECLMYFMGLIFHTKLVSI